MNSFGLLSRGAFVAAAALACLVASPTSYAQQVVVNSTTTNCTAGTTALSILPNGNISITCTVTSSSVFTCSASASPTSIQSGSSATSTISASGCINGNPSTYAWILPISSTTTNAANSASFVVAAPPGLAADQIYQFPVTVTPLSGTAWTGQASLTVTAAGTVVTGPGNCPGGASVADVFSKGNKRFEPALNRGATITYQIPAANTVANGLYMRFDTAQVPGFLGLGIQIAVSSCPGDFTANVPAGCSQWGTTDGGALSMAAVTPGLPGNYGAQCILAPGTQYYLNVRNVNQDLTTPSCTPSQGACWFYIGMVS